MSKEENMFDELNEDFLNDEQETEVVQETKNNRDDEEEMSPGDFESFNYLKNPDVGEYMEVIVAKVIKKPGRELKAKETGKTFYTGLKDKNDKRVETIIETLDGDRFTITSWGLYFALFNKDTDFQKLAKKKGTYKGLKLKITHNYNGKDATTETKDLMKLRGFKTEEEAKEHKKKVSLAMKEGTIYSVEVAE